MCSVQTGALTDSVTISATVHLLECPQHLNQVGLTELFLCQLAVTLTLSVLGLLTECQKDNKAEVEDAVVYIDGLVMWGHRSGWGFTVRMGGRM